MAGVTRSCDVRSATLEGFASRASTLAAELSKLLDISSDAAMFINKGTLRYLACPMRSGVREVMLYMTLLWALQVLYGQRRLRLRSRRHSSRSLHGHKIATKCARMSQIGLM